MEPSSDDFKILLAKHLSIAQELGFTAVDVNSGHLHRFMGAYPGSNHRMPACCNVMRQEMSEGDLVVEEPPKGNGANLTIRFRLPRP